jgi:hypothetical protein
MALCLLGALGCGGTRTTYPVQGKVAFPDGTPLTGGLVVFESLETDPPLSARGEIQSDGSFRLGTYKLGDGAVLGRHRALVVPPVPKQLDEANPGLQLIQPHLQRFETSGLEFTVMKKSNNLSILVHRP